MEPSCRSIRRLTPDRPLREPGYTARTMTGIVSRLILAVVTIASVPAIWMLLLFLQWETRWTRDQDLAIALANLVTALLLIGAWVLIWRREIRWSPRRSALTIVATVGSLMLAGGFGFWIGEATRESEAGHIFGGIVWALLWLAATAVIWRETASERIERMQRLGVHGVTCPTCGYNLTGMKEARCPECGATFTLEQLFASVAESSV